MPMALPGSYVPGQGGLHRHRRQLGQRQATKDAGRIAGLEVKRIINEPTAAAVGSLMIPFIR